MHYGSTGVAMALAKPIEPITADDEFIRAALDDADVPALLPALAYITGDMSLLRDDVRIDPTLMIMDQGGLTPEQLATARQVAFDAILAFRDAGSRPGPPIEGADLARIVQFMAGGLPIDEYMDMA